MLENVKIDVYLNELMILDIWLHLFSRFDEMVVSAIDLELSPRSGSMRNTRPEAFRVFGNELIVDPILEGAKNDHGSRIIDFNFLH